MTFLNNTFNNFRHQWYITFCNFRIKIYFCDDFCESVQVDFVLTQVGWVSEVYDSNFARNIFNGFIIRIFFLEHLQLTDILFRIYRRREHHYDLHASLSTLILYYSSISRFILLFVLNEWYNLIHYIFWSHLNQKKLSCLKLLR